MTHLDTLRAMADEPALSPDEREAVRAAIAALELVGLAEGAEALRFRKIGTWQGVPVWEAPNAIAHDDRALAARLVKTALRLREK